MGTCPIMAWVYFFNDFVPEQSRPHEAACTLHRYLCTYANTNFCSDQVIFLKYPQSRRVYRNTSKWVHLSDHGLGVFFYDFVPEQSRPHEAACTLSVCTYTNFCSDQVIFLKFPVPAIPWCTQPIVFVSSES